jgi:hypothetical protein
MSKLAILGAACGLVLASSAATIAGPKGGVGGPATTPGHMMQQHGSVPGHPGASGYAPGHVKKSARGYNARAYAPRYRSVWR